PVNIHDGVRISRTWTVAEWIRDMFLPLCRRKWKLSTASTTGDRIRKHLITDLGSLEIQSVTRELLQRYLEQKAAANCSKRKDGDKVFAAGFTSGAGIPASEPPSAIHFSSSWRSFADCHLFSRSFAKHFFTARSSARGVMGRREITGGGCEARIDAIKLAWLFPSNAFVAVTNS